MKANPVLISGSIKQKLKYKQERFHMTSRLPYCQRDVYVHVRNDRHFRKHFRASEHDRQPREDKKLTMHFRKVKNEKLTVVTVGFA